MIIYKFLYIKDRTNSELHISRMEKKEKMFKGKNAVHFHFSYILYIVCIYIYIYIKSVPESSAWRSRHTEKEEEEELYQCMPSLFALLHQVTAQHGI